MGYRDLGAPAQIMGVFPQLRVREIVKVRLDFQANHGWRRVGQVVLLDLGVHCGLVRGVNQGIGG